MDLTCRCVARAIMKHLTFSKGQYLFLEDLQEANDLCQFSYKFEKNLKLGNAFLPPLHKNKAEEESKMEVQTNYDKMMSNMKQSANLASVDVGQTGGDSDIEEDLERDGDDTEVRSYENNLLQLEDMEMQYIEQIRNEEETKRLSLPGKRSDRLSGYLQKREELENQIAQKEMRIDNLNSLIQKKNAGEDIVEILEMSGEPSMLDMKSRRQDEIMQDVNLDVIESRGSLEQSSAFHHPAKSRRPLGGAQSSAVQNQGDDTKSHQSIYVSDSSVLGSTKGVPGGSVRGLPPIGRSQTQKQASMSHSKKSFESEMQLESFSKDKIKAFLRH